MQERSHLKIIGLGESTPVEDELVPNDTVLQILRDRGVETNGKNGLDTERLVGIRTRWWSQLSSSEHAIAASRRAIEDAQARTDRSFTPDQIRLVHSGGSSPDNVFPACACEIQGALEVPPEGCEARDVSLACTSWVDGLLLAGSRMRDRGFRYGLVANGETVGTRLNAPTSLSFCLWGDGGGAAVLEYDPEGDPNYGILVDKTVSDGQYAHWTKSIKLGTHPDHAEYDYPDASMLEYGRDIHRYAIRAVASTIKELLVENGLEGENPYLVPHNSNLGMVHQIGKRLGIPPERVLTRIRERGNTSSASIPVTLAHYKDQFERGDLLILAAFGGGMSISVVLYRWV